MDFIIFSILFFLVVLLDLISSLSVGWRLKRLEKRVERLESRRTMDIEKLNGNFENISNQFKAIGNYFGAEFYDPNKEKHPLEFKPAKKIIFKR